MANDEAPRWQPLLWTDPERFAENLYRDDEVRFAGYHDARDTLFGEVIRYGFRLTRPEWIEPLRRLYDRLIGGGMPIDQRWDVLHYVANLVENSKGFTVNSFLPFIVQDPSRAVVVQAVFEYVSHGPLQNDDPMFFPKELIQIIDDGEPRNPGAVFGTLLVLGDWRVCKLLWPLRDCLSDQEAHEAAQCTSGFVAAATIDFVLDWMEGLEGTAKDARFGSLALHLILQRRYMQVASVVTGLRAFPVTSVSPEDQRAMLKPIPLEEYRAMIAPRLLALERSEPEPKVMPEVLRAWGLAAPSSNN